MLTVSDCLINLEKSFFVVAKSEKKNIALFGSEPSKIPSSLLNRAIFLTFRRI